MQLYHDSLWKAREWGFLLYWQIKYEAGNIRTVEDAGPYISGGTKAPPYELKNTTAAPTWCCRRLFGESDALRMTGLVMVINAF